MADGRVVGVIVGFPAGEGEALARRFLKLTAPRVPPWRWPRLLRHLNAASGMSPTPALGSWYVDALAVAEDARRRGVARALLADAEAIARAQGATGVSLDTGLENAAARSLYEASGFEQRDIRRARDERAARAIGGAGFVGSSSRCVTRSDRTPAQWSAIVRRSQVPGLLIGRSTRSSASATRRDLGLGELGEERQRDRALGDVLADRELAGPVPVELAVERHQVDGGQVGLALHAELAQRADRAVAVGAAAAAGRRTRTSRGGRRRRPRTAARARARPPGPASAARYQPATRARAASMSSRRSSWARPSAQAMSESR